MNEDNPPIALDYQPSTRRQLWPSDPFALPRVMGIILGFLNPFVFRMWDQWREGILRIPLLWYQQAWPGGIASLLVLSTVFLLIRTKFFSAFLFGTVIGFVILLLNYMVEVEYFGVDILGRITGHSWN